MKAMTDKQAHKESVRRWGKNAYNSLRTNAITKEERAAILAKPKEERTKEERTHAAASYRCTVGILKTIGGLCSFNEVQGQGDTWEEAFAAADRAKAADEARWAKPRASAI